jgi:hypothetical protein
VCDGIVAYAHRPTSTAGAERPTLMGPVGPVCRWAGSGVARIGRAARQGEGAVVLLGRWAAPIADEAE